MPYILKLSKTQQRGFNKPIFGYDIETYSRKNKFYCASLYAKYKYPDWDYKNYKTFFSKRDIIEEFKTSKFRNSFIAATNLQFDFIGTFFKEPEELGFNMLFRGSELIIAKAYINNKIFKPRRKDFSTAHSLTFIDTRNYAMLSVEKLGKILTLPKLIKPKSLGKIPQTEKEKQELVTYNIRDSEISQKAIEFFYKSFINFGATPKSTIAATSMSLFKNKYLHTDYFVHPVDTLLGQFKSYYGGRCEAFSRGLIKNYNYFDVNSLYPFCMTKEFPDPNTLRITYKNDISYIKDYDGISDVDIEAPYLKYPLLPVRTETKLYFPVGTWRASYTHIELRKALELGYKIKKIHKMYYFTKNISPFKEFVTDLYYLRLKYQEENNPMEYVLKILLNSFYGKLGQRFWDRDNWQPFNLTLEELNKLDSFERFGNYIRTVKKLTRPANFCFPIWASYVTSYARLHLYDFIVRSNPIYCDTDSLITRKDFGDSKKLGELKLEFPIKYGFIVKPKFYAILNKNNDEIVKIKGMGTRLTLKEFEAFLKHPTKTYDKFVKFKEAMRRKLDPNEIIEMSKEMKLEDNKRLWKNAFDPYKFESSEPVSMEGGAVDLYTTVTKT